MKYIFNLAQALFFGAMSGIMANDFKVSVFASIGWFSCLTLHGIWEELEK